MKLSYAWLRDWVELDATPEQVADALTRRGFYVEGVERRGGEFPGVVVARVLEVQKHPNADRLSLCRVDSGAGEKRVVCGAPNVHAGMIAPLATIGAQLPDGVVIKASKIRGEESQGMLCSARELQLSEDHSGILDLRTFTQDPALLTPGRPVAELLGPPDSVLEVEIPFNRPDGMGVVGLAREVKAALGGRWTPAAQSRFAARWQGRADFDLDLEDREGCPRYIAQVIERVKIGPAPPWLVRRLESVGQRSVNNVVDLTNWILFELGQPVHAFDLDRLKGPQLRVRRARAGERLTTLDGKERALDPEVLLIADREGPVALAGVMGGEATEVTATTTRLLLEVAYFDPRRVRRGARALGIATEASKRFERGADPEMPPIATARFLALLRELDSDVGMGPARERNHTEGKRKTLTLRAPRVARVVGVDIGGAESKRLLETFEFGAEPGDPLRVTVPSWRVDVTQEDDLVEEVARAHGYDRIPDVPLESRGALARRTEMERFIESARAAMLSRGLHEAWCTTLVSEREAVAAALLLGQDPTRLVRLANPMSRESEIVRPNLVPGLLRACAHNLKQGVESVRLFEIGNGALARAGELPEERPLLAAVVIGPRWARAHDASQQPVDFDDARGLWDAWLEEMRVDTPRWRAYAAPGWKPDASAEVASGASSIGWAGTLSQALLRDWDIEVPVHLFVSRLDASAAAVLAAPRLSLPSRFPAVRRDLAFFFPAGAQNDAVQDILRREGGPWLASVELFDVYRKDPTGPISLAYALRFQNPERTLADSEIQDLQDRMVAAVAREMGGQLRTR
ncbi:MAG TPA: phenylalanine--tRNA ligase subunit beta [Candidatus Sulfotelmatobacter sp.]|nr:phenylalanine--tRNA ligase subunit beta [Candidatus Sulfotelmatobacter sp.]